MKTFETKQQAIDYFTSKFEFKTEKDVCLIGTQKYIIAATPLAIDDVILSHIVDAMREFNFATDNDDARIYDEENDLVEAVLTVLTNNLNVKIEYLTTDY